MTKDLDIGLSAMFGFRQMYKLFTELGLQVNALVMLMKHFGMNNRYLRIEL